jgi:hypothetical protein
MRFAYLNFGTRKPRPVAMAELPLDLVGVQAARSRVLFARQQELSRQLREVDAELDKLRKSFSYAKGYCVPVRLEAFKREVEDYKGDG